MKFTVYEWNLPGEGGQGQGKGYGELLRIAAQNSSSIFAAKILLAKNWPVFNYNAKVRLNWIVAQKAEESLSGGGLKRANQKRSNFNRHTTQNGI